MQGLDLDDVKRQLVDVWALDSDTDIASVAKAALDLARRAYTDNDAEALRDAEATLYVINVANAFAPPLHGGPAVAWTTLMRHKLASLRRAYGGRAPLDATAMTNELTAAVGRWGAYNHPLIATLRDQPSDLGAYRIWAKNWFGSCVGFSAQLAALAQRASGRAKHVVLENLIDEFDERVTHDVLRVRFYESLGLKFSATEALADPDRVVEATELLNARTGLAFLRDPIWALGCFYGVEGNWPPECRLHLEINRARRSDDHTLEYWTSHAEADEGHAAEWLNALAATCQTDEQRAAAVDGAMIQLRLRWKMYDAIAERVATR